MGRFKRVGLLALISACQLFCISAFPQQSTLGSGSGGGGGGATNGIQMLNGLGTNTTLRGVTIAGATTNASGTTVSGTVTRTNYTTGARSVESAVGHLFYPSNSATAAININATDGSVTASNLVAGAARITNAVLRAVTGAAWFWASDTWESTNSAGTVVYSFDPSGSFSAGPGATINLDGADGTIESTSGFTVEGVSGNVVIMHGLTVGATAGGITNHGIYTGSIAGATNANPTNVFGAGVIPPAKLGSGSGGATKFLREDATWQTPSGSGGSATNAVTTISSNGVAISAASTNVHFWAGANITLSFTNSPEGDVDVVVTVSDPFSVTTLNTGNVNMTNLYTLLTNVVLATDSNSKLAAATIGNLQTLGAVATNDTRNLGLSGILQLNQSPDAVTNNWAINTAFGLGTNCFYTQGAGTIGVTGVANGPATGLARYGELAITATGDITFTNPASFKANDFLTSRIITNGNTAVLACEVIAGRVTNFCIVQFK